MENKKRYSITLIDHKTGIKVETDTDCLLAFYDMGDTIAQVQWLMDADKNTVLNIVKRAMDFVRDTVISFLGKGTKKEGSK